MPGEASKQSWWQTLPGLMTATAGCISAITALIIALNQAGVFKSRDAATDASAVSSGASKNVNPTTEPAPSTTPDNALIEKSGAPPDSAETKRLGALTDAELLQELERANVSSSVGKTTMLSWLADEDRTYRRIAHATVRLLAGKRLKGTAPDLDVIKYHYLEAVGVSGGGQLPVDANVNDAKLRLAIVAAFNDKNGANAARIEGVLEPR